MRKRSKFNELPLKSELVPPFLEGDETRQMAAAIQKLETQSVFDQNRANIFDAGVAYGLAKGTEKANDLARENYESGINKGNLDAFTYMIAGPNVALLDRSGEKIKWYSGETITDIIGTNDNPTQLRLDNHRVKYFDPDAQWITDTSKLTNASMSQDPKQRKTPWAFSEYKDLLYLDIDKLRAKTKDGKLKGRVLTPLEKPFAITPPPGLNLMGTVPIENSTNRLLGFSLVPTPIGPADLVAKITKGNTLPVDLKLSDEDVKAFSALALLDYKAQPNNLFT